MLPMPTQTVINRAGLVALIPIILFVIFLGLHMLSKRCKEEPEQFSMSSLVSTGFWISLIVFTSGALMAIMLPLIGK